MSREGGKVPQKDLLRAVHEEFKSWSVSEIENLLRHSFFVDGWFTTLNHNKDVGLGVRALLELRPWLLSTFPDAIAECGACQQLHSRVTPQRSTQLLQGISCSNSECAVKMHPHCSLKWATRKAKCPSCNTVWKRGEE